jgi:hypothetical protein
MEGAGGTGKEGAGVTGTGAAGATTFVLGRPRKIPMCMMAQNQGVLGVDLHVENVSRYIKMILRVIPAKEWESERDQMIE